MVGLTALVHKAHVYEVLLKLMTSVDAYVYLSSHIISVNVFMGDRYHAGGER